MPAHWPEPIRFIIWDLDETFWQGTLTEGGITYRQHVHDIVMQLAQRGIISGICSKNDAAPVRDILTQHGIWDHFVFPSIDWEPKGPRIARIVEQIQLRPSTILFIDDNPMNLHEAKHFVPDLQIADETIIPTLLDDPLLRGKPDPQRSRLAQYKLLETRKTDEASAGDARAFLRTSNIRVSILHDVSDHLDRVIELINRTNQLNFTKIRLPEDSAQARERLAEDLASFRWQVGLVRVIDAYGDYGFCGFYAYNILARRLDHFCFSCRTLGMGVESWLYARLGRPSIQVRGEVLTDLKQDAPIDWITFAAATEGHAQVPQASLGTVYLRGSCDLAAVGHYLGLVSDKLIQDFNISYNGLNLRLDHSMFIRHTLRPPGDHAREALASIFHPADMCQSLLPQSAREADLFVLSFKADVSALYRHKATGLLTPFSVPGFNNVHDATALAGEIDTHFGTPNGRAAFRALCENFDYAGVITEADFRENLRLALDIIPSDKPVVIILGLEPKQKPGAATSTLNDWTRDVAADYTNVALVDLADCITSPADLRGTLHFDRGVYMRLYERVVAAVKSFPQRRERAIA
jgi:FkbH-like protein